MRLYLAQQLEIISSRYILIVEYIITVFNALKSFSMSFKSGEYFGKNSNW